MYRFLFAVAMLAVVLALAAPAQAPAPSANGRYQIVINPTVRADTFLLDSQTGRIWQVVQYDELVGEPSIWEYRTRIDNEEQFGVWVKTQKGKKVSK